jgi:hypothetical protein
MAVGGAATDNGIVEGSTSVAVGVGVGVTGLAVQADRVVINPINIAPKMKRITRNMLTEISVLLLAEVIIT